MISRRKFLKTGAAAGGALVIPWSISLRSAYGAALDSSIGLLSDPAIQPKFVELAPNALDPGFIFQPHPNTDIYHVQMAQTVQNVGLVNRRGKSVATAVWGYGGSAGVSWPGPTFEVQKDQPTQVKWSNELRTKNGKPLPHLLPVDESIHWCYSLPGYTQYSIGKDGVPLITHLHGGHSDYQYDGNPEFFMNPGRTVVGPQWMGAVDKVFTYSNDQVAGNLWYHDHALGITRLNVYAGLAGFYFIRDEFDTGKPGNPLNLPAFPYELAYAIQDRMFTDDGGLFYPAYAGDPFWEDFIDGEGATPPIPGGPSGLAEFFGDHMTVNGKIWPKTDVEPRNYRMRLLNGSDSRFLVLRFRVAANPAATSLDGASTPLMFHVIGSDQGLAGAAMQTDTLVFEPGSRYDIVVNFGSLADQRIIMENIGGDAPFGGDFGAAVDPADLFVDRQTDRIMAFDVTRPLSAVPDNFAPAAIASYGGNTNAVSNNRKVALFEGKDEFGRLQPLLGAEIAGTFTAIPWHMTPTETPALGSTEEWEIYNFTGDAHPVHLHLTNFEVLGRHLLSFDDTGPAQTVVQHNGTTGEAPGVSDVVVGDAVSLGPLDGYAENAPKDMVTALPGQMTKIRATFDKPGRYVWHCHILSHEDHEMMRVLQVGG